MEINTSSLVGKLTVASSNPMMIKTSRKGTWTIKILMGTNPIISGTVEARVVKICTHMLCAYSHMVSVRLAQIRAIIAAIRKFF